MLKFDLGLAQFVYIRKIILFLRGVLEIEGKWSFHNLL